jgi:hypothetical protein
MISHRLCRISALRRDFLLVTWAFGGEERIVSLLATVIQKMIYSKQRQGIVRPASSRGVRRWSAEG